MIGLFRRYFETIRHLEARQTWGRIAAVAKRRAAKLLTPTPPLDVEAVGLSSETPFVLHSPHNKESHVARGRFRFLSREVDLGWPPDWSGRGETLPWRFQLHSFRYLHLLRRQQQVALCRSWIRSNPPVEEPAWHPYPTSLRIVHWCRAHLGDRAIDRSLFRQAAYLVRNLETYLPGNHLLENARALFLAARYFGGRGEADHWESRARQILATEVPRQILDDGGHFERSPMYHGLVLEGLLDVVNVLPPGDSLRTILVSRTRRMERFLRALTHPDGDIAQFSDSARSFAPPPTTLMDYARRLTPRSGNVDDAGDPVSKFPSSGYFVHCRDPLYLAIDGGPVGPDLLPAHGHADIFSFELSVCGTRLVVDTGASTYLRGPVREHERSTAAHNTLVVDGVDQAECWGTFRVARRYSPHDVSFRHDGCVSYFDGSFSGYAHLVGDEIEHRRRIRCRPSQGRVNVRDLVTGRGRHHVESRLHLHPGTQVIHRDSRRLIVGRGEIRVEVLGSLTPGVEEGWYAPDFGDREAAPVVRFERDKALPTELSYSIRLLDS